MVAVICHCRIMFMCQFAIGDVKALMKMKMTLASFVLVALLKQFYQVKRMIAGIGDERLVSIMTCKSFVTLGRGIGTKD